MAKRSRPRSSKQSTRSQLAAKLRRAQEQVRKLQRQLQQTKRRSTPSKPARQKPPRKTEPIAARKPSRTVSEISRRRIARLPEPESSAFISSRSRHATRDRALHVLARMRKGESFRSATNAEGIDRRTARLYLADELRVTKSGRLKASDSDIEVREILVPFSDGDNYARVTGSEDASLLGRYFSERGKLLQAFNNPQLSSEDLQARIEAFEKESEGRSVSVQVQNLKTKEWETVNVPLIADGETILELSAAGLIKVEGFYRAVKGGVR